MVFESLIGCVNSVKCNISYAKRIGPARCQAYVRNNGGSIASTMLHVIDLCNDSNFGIVFFRNLDESSSLNFGCMACK